MGSRTAVVTKPIGSRGALRAACLILVSVTAAGCVLGNDNDRPVLAVDPLWDVSPTDAFAGESCDSAGVTFMTWEIQTSRGRTIKEATELERCKPLDFLGLVPGEYQLVLVGYDHNEVERWRSTCTDLVLGRFDVLYECPVDQVEAEEGEPDDGEDAGVADAG